MCCCVLYGPETVDLRSGLSPCFSDSAGSTLQYTTRKKNKKTVCAEYTVPVTNVIVVLLVFMYLYVCLSIYVFAKTI